jgi:hypothetical protein
MEQLERLKHLEQAPLVERLEPLEPWIDVRRSNGKFFPTIPDDSTGFEASYFTQKALFFLGEPIDKGASQSFAIV